MIPSTEKLPKKYIDNPPEGMTSNDIRSMSSEVLLDTDYFLNDDGLDYLYSRAMKFAKI